MAEYKVTEEDYFSSDGGRLIFDNVPWKDWETAGVAAVEEALDKAKEPCTWTKGNLLRYLHLAISYRNDGKSGTDYTEEDVTLTVELLLKSRAWFEKQRLTWTPKLRNDFRDMIFYQGRDKFGRPFAFIRPLESKRDVWSEDYAEMNKAIMALCDCELDRAYLPGIAEQTCFIIDLGALGVMDIPYIVPALRILVGDLTDQFPSRGGTHFVVNTGWALAAAVNTVLLFAQAETRKKIQVFSGGFGDHAEKYFDLAALPVEYGGEGTLGCGEEIKEAPEGNGYETKKVPGAPEGGGGDNHPSVAEGA